MNRFFRGVIKGVLYILAFVLVEVCVGESAEGLEKESGVAVDRAEAMAWGIVLQKQLENLSHPLLNPFSIIGNISQCQMRKTGLGFQPLSEVAHSLFVETPNMHERVQPFTSKTTLFSDTFSADVVRLSIPIGAWVTYKSSELDCRVLVPYLGAEKWKFSTDEKRRIWLARNGNEPELVGFSLRTEDDDALSLAEQLDELPLEKVRCSLSFQIDEKNDLKSLQALSLLVPLALTSSIVFDDDSIDALSNLNVMAFQGYIEDHLLEKVAEIRTLRMLAFGVDKAEDREGEILRFPKMEKLDHLALMNAVDLYDWREVLEGLPNLESLVLVNSTKPAEWEGRSIRDFNSNPGLKVLGIRNDECRFIEREALGTAANLEYLHLRGGAFLKADGNYPGLSGLSKVRYLSISDTEASTEMLDEWFDSGNLADLRYFEGYYVPDFKQCRELEAVSIQQDLERSRFYDLSRFAEAPESLYMLSMVRMSRRDFEDLKLPHPENIRYLYFYSAEVDKPELFYQFENVERLNVRGNSGRIQELDFSKFPNLKVAALERWSELESVKGLASHPALSTVTLFKCRYFEHLGAAAPNDTLRSVFLSQLPSLQDLSALNEMTQCQNFTLSYCDAVETYGEILDNNPLKYYLVYKCKHLEFQRKQN